MSVSLAAAPEMRGSPTLEARNEAVLAAWAKGQSGSFIADRMGLTKGTVMGVVYRARLSGCGGASRSTTECRSPGTKMETIMRRVLPLWAAGLTAAQIAERCGVSRSHVSNAIHRARLLGLPGASHRPRGRRPKERHASPGMVEAFAVLRADGTIDPGLIAASYEQATGWAMGRPVRRVCVRRVVDATTKTEREALADRVYEAIQAMIYDEKPMAKALLYRVAAALRGYAE